MQTAVFKTFNGCSFNDLVSYGRTVCPLWFLSYDLVMALLNLDFFNYQGISTALLQISLYIVTEHVLTINERQQNA